MLVFTAAKSRENIDFNQKEQGEILTCVFHLTLRMS